MFLRFWQITLVKELRIWICKAEALRNIVNIREDLGQMATEIKIAFPVSHNALFCPRCLRYLYRYTRDPLLFYYSMLDKHRGVHTMKDYRLKFEIAQRELSDLQRIPSAL
jgi:hypothetical protein